MFGILVYLFQITLCFLINALDEQAFVVCMSKTDTMVVSLTKGIDLKDKIVAIGMKVEDKELVYIALNGLAPC
jgi:hypothetical protein